MRAHTECHPGEIDLCEYLIIIKKRKKLLLGIVLLSLIAATVIQILKPKEFEANAIIKLDTIINIPKEESMQVLKRTQIPESYFRNKTGSAGSLDVKIITEDIPNSNLIKLRVLYSDTNAALNICNYVATSFLDSRNKTYHEAVSFLNDRIQDLNSRNKGINLTMESLRKKIMSYSRSSSISGTASYIKALADYENIYNALDNEMFGLITKLSNSSESRLIGPPLLNKNLLKPDFIKGLITAGLLGLLAGILIIFFQETCKTNNS